MQEDRTGFEDMFGDAGFQGVEGFQGPGTSELRLAEDILPLRPMPYS